MFSQRRALFSSTSVVAALRLVAMWLGACRLGMCSSSALVAWYLDLRSWSITSCFLFGESHLFASTRASCLTYVVMCLRWYLKSSMGLIFTPSILYDLFMSRYLMFVPSLHLIMLILFICRFVLALRTGFPYPQSAPVASHLVVSNSSPVYLLKRCSFFI